MYKHINRRILSLVLCIVMVFSMMPGHAHAAPSSDTTADGLLWDLAGDGTLTITGNGYLETKGPWENYGIDITQLVIGEGIITIGDRVFANLPLQSISFPSTLVYIGNYAFENCDSLTAIDLPASVAQLGEGAFWSCDNLASVFFAGDPPAFGNTTFDMTHTEAVFFCNNTAQIAQDCRFP